MKYLLDTNHWSYLQRKHPTVVRHIESLSQGDEIFMSVIVQAELRAGVELLPDGKRKQHLLEIYQETVRDFPFVLPIDSRVAEQFALILAQLRRDGHPIETHDIWIAATAIVHDLVVVTNDEHFQRVAGLRIENWIE